MVRSRMEDAEEEEYAPEAGPSGEYAKSGEQLTDEETGAVAPRSMPSAGDCRPFDQFDQLAVSFVAGSMCVCRPVPLKVSQSHIPRCLDLRTHELHHNQAIQAMCLGRVDSGQLSSSVLSTPPCDFRPS
jgi:hypothetical protein